MPSDDAAIELGTAIRRLMDAAVLSECDDSELQAAGRDIDAVTDRLSAESRPTMPWPDGSSMRKGNRPFSPVIGAANPLAPPMTVRVLEDRSVVSEVTMRPIHEGPPGALHGGWVATLLDQLLGHANAAAGVGAFTGTLTVRYRRPTPYGVPLTVRARTDSVEGRRVHASGEIVVDGEVTAEATGLFIQPSPERVEDLREVTEDRAAAS